jgi:16S rRNA G966 N2-methylase RsmD
LELILKPEYQELVYELPDEDYQELKQSIKEYGLYNPIIINQAGIILDGHHRYKICKELGLLDKLTEQNLWRVKFFGDSYLERIYIIDANLSRRQLIPMQRGDLVLKRDKLVEEREAHLRMIRGTKSDDEEEEGDQGTLEQICSRVDEDEEEDEEKSQGKKPGMGSSESRKGRTRNILAKRAGISETQLRKIEYILKHGTEEEKSLGFKGKITVHKLWSKIKKRLKRDILQNETPIIELPAGVSMVNEDFVKYCKDNIPDNSIDLIFTDPPYGLDTIPLYKSLADVAARVLKDGGSLVTYVGQYTLPEIIRNIESSGLRYWWILCVKHTGGHATMYQKGVFVDWKPLLWYVKGDKTNAIDFMHDYIESIPPQKDLHEWEQSTVEADHVISKLTVENQTILDPFMGSATTGIASLKLGRRFIGIEKDKQRFAVARSRMSQYLMSSLKIKTKS